MKRIYVNLKRFDVPAALGGVNRLAPMEEWAPYIIAQTAGALADTPMVHCTFFFPEAHLPAAIAANRGKKAVTIGCQSVYREDIAPGGNFGAFTAGRPATAMQALGCGAALIGHCEERRSYADILAEADVQDASVVDRLLNKQVRCAVQCGMQALFCIGEADGEQDVWQQVLGRQLSVGLDGVDRANISIAYEPLWAIGPGKTPPDKAYIEKIARFVKQETGGLPLVYGGGLKADNAAMLASVEEIDGGLIALTRFTGEIGFYPDEFLDIVNRYVHSL